MIDALCSNPLNVSEHKAEVARMGQSTVMLGDLLYDSDQRLQTVIGNAMVETGGDQISGKGVS